MALAALLFMMACADPPTRPPAPSVAPAPTASDYQALAAWFAERDIILPEKMPPQAAAKPAGIAEILGDGYFDRAVDFWDLWGLWSHLTVPTGLLQLDLDLLDIDRDGTIGWIDLGLLGDYLYGSKANPARHRPASPCRRRAPSTSISSSSTTASRRPRRRGPAQAADRWEAVITEDLPDQEIDFDSASDYWKAFWDAWSGMHGRPRIQDQETVDDVRIYLGKQDRNLSSHASGGTFWNRKPADGDLPVLGVITFSAAALSRSYDSQFEGTMLHEIGHVLGIGTLWYYLDFLGDPEGDPHFKGMMAIDAFNRAGGWNYRDNKVPVQMSGGHWRGSVFGDELMTGARAWPDRRPLSEITLQALADMGYRVDITRADPYAVPREAVSKPVAGGEVWCEVLRMPADLTPEAPTAF